jgi:hypothetical protein
VVAESLPPGRKTSRKNNFGSKVHTPILTDALVDRNANGTGCHWF